MRIICRYDEEMEGFLQKAVDYTLNIYGDSLDISNLEEIELCNIKEFTYETDGKTIDDGRKILVTSRLYDLLPTLNISELENSNVFRMIINTLYHEMGHVMDWRRFPNIYAAALKSSNMKEALPSLFWAEYLAEKRSSMNELVENEKFCEDFAAKKWNAYKFDMENASETNYFYMNKVIPYVFARKRVPCRRIQYINNLTNDLLKEYLLILNNEVLRLEDLGFFDTVDELFPLYEIMNEYYKKFRIRFKPGRESSL